MRWNSIAEMIRRSPNRVEFAERKASFFPSLRPQAHYGLDSLDEMVRHVDRLIINGYLRLCTSKIQEVNALVQAHYPGNKLVVATDVFGGIFAISNGDFDGPDPCIWYYAPDTLQWENLNIDYDHFLQWAFSAALAQFYEPFSWDGMEALLCAMDESQGVLIYPFLWAKECDLTTATKQAVPFRELVEQNVAYQTKLYT